MPHSGHRSAPSAWCRLVESGDQEVVQTIICGRFLPARMSSSALVKWAGAVVCPDLRAVPTTLAVMEFADWVSMKTTRCCAP
jgi:hypothetical protein